MSVIDLKIRGSKSFDRMINDGIKHYQEEIFGGNRKSFYGFSLSRKSIIEKLAKQYKALTRM